MDISGEHQTDLSHDITKARLDSNGAMVEKVAGGQLQGEVQRVLANKDPNYCGSCYGGVPGPSGCCNTCDEVRESYVRKGWSFSNPDGIAQCVDEGWTEKIAKQNSEGCRISGNVRVNKVIGNLHFSHGKSFQANAMYVQELVPYLKDNNHHDFGHIINKFQFEADYKGTAKSDAHTMVDDLTRTLKKRLNIVNPLDGAVVHPEGNDSYMYQCESTSLSLSLAGEETQDLKKEPCLIPKPWPFQDFLKVVSTSFNLLSGGTVDSHQYSVTEFERNLAEGNAPGKEGHGVFTSHSTAAIPGVFINYEISPMKVIHTETRQSFAHFLTSTCAIVGGVLTVAGLVDSFIFSSRQRLSGTNPVEGFGSRNGKMM